MFSRKRAIVATICVCIAILGVVIFVEGFVGDEARESPDGERIDLHGQRQSRPTIGESAHRAIVNTDSSPVIDTSLSHLETSLYHEIMNRMVDRDVPIQGCEVSCLRDGSCTANLVFENGTLAQLVGRIPTEERMGGVFVETRDEPDGSVVIVVHFADARSHGVGE